MRFEIDLKELRTDTIARAYMDDDAARTIYFALCNERDKVVKDIAAYHEMAARVLDEMCDTHGAHEFDPFCRRCQNWKDKHGEYLKRHRQQDEDLMFLGEYLNKITAILFEMGGNNTKEFGSWLSV
jgi:hypothetical protein